MKNKIQEILDNTPKDYLLNTAKVHLVSYPTVNTAENLLNRLYYQKEWLPYEHSAIMPGCKGFIAHGMFGYMGIMHVRDLPRDSIIHFADPKNTGFAMGEVRDIRPFKRIDYTVLIAGEHEGKTICFTFHPGDPVKPSMLPSAEWNGFTIRALEARDTKGIEYVRLIGQ